MGRALAAFSASVAVVLLIVISVWLIWRLVSKQLWRRAERNAIWAAVTYIDDDGDTVVRLRKVARVGSAGRVLAESLPLLKQQVLRVDDPALGSAEIEAKMLADQRNAVSTAEY